MNSVNVLLKNISQEKAILKVFINCIDVKTIDIQPWNPKFKNLQYKLKR